MDFGSAACIFYFWSRNTHYSLCSRCLIQCLIQPTHYSHPVCQANQKWIKNKSSLKTVKILIKEIYCFWDKNSSKGYYFMVLMFLTNWNLIFILVNFFHFLPISWATWFCNVWLLTSHWEKNKSIYAVSLNQAKHCRKHQKSWGQPKSWEVVLPNQLSRIHNHRT